MTLALLYLASYLIGAIPFGVVIARAAGVDILSQGSGNPGATNVWRILGPKFGVAVFLLDVLKGLGPALAGAMIGGTKEQALYCGMIAIVGHSLSPFLRFKGGKGISTGLGALLGSVPIVALSSFAIFLVSMFLTRWVSFSSLIAAVAMMTFCFLFGEPPTVKWVLGGMALFIFYRHRANIGRLLNGTEPKFKFKSKKEDSSTEESAENGAEEAPTDESEPKKDAASPPMNADIAKTARIDAPQASINALQAHINAPQASINASPGSINAPQGSINASQGSINASPGSINAPQGSIEAPQASINAPQVSINAPQASIKASQGSIEAPQVSDDGNTQDDSTGQGRR